MLHTVARTLKVLCEQKKGVQFIENQTVNRKFCVFLLWSYSFFLLTIDNYFLLTNEWQFFFNINYIGTYRFYENYYLFILFIVIKKYI